MGFFNKLLKTSLTVLETPVAVVKDAVTLGGALEDEDKPYTIQKLKEIGENYEEMKESLDD